MRPMVLIATALALITTAAAAQDADWDKVVAAAKQEGKIVIYNGGQSVDLYAAAIKSFEKAYGIQVEQIALRGSELTERVRTEQAAGRFIGDVQLHATTVAESNLGQLQPHGRLPNLAHLRPEVKATDILVPAYLQHNGILINTNLVKSGEITSWKDLLDPKWKGKILMDDPRPIGGGHNFFTVMYKTYGRPFHEAMVAQQPVFSRDPARDARRVATGEYPIYLPQIFALARALHGLPVHDVVPSEGVIYSIFIHAMLKNAPHPNAARVFMNHFLSLEPQLIYANGWQIPVSQGVLDKTNGEAKEVASAKLLGTSLVAERPAMTALAKEIYK